MFNLFGKSASLDDLIARKKYAQALVVMREEFRRKSPDAPARERFADLLILADRRAEAIPILLGLADEHLRFRFFDKAKDALGRVAQLESGRADVASRLQRIAEVEKAPLPTLLDRKSRLAARKAITPEPKPPAVPAVASDHETRNEPAPPEEWDTDLSSPIPMVLEPLLLDREEPKAPEDDPIEVDPLEAGAEENESSDPNHVELMDLFSIGESGLAGGPIRPGARARP
jgi:hypothetical protein